MTRLLHPLTLLHPFILFLCSKPRMRHRRVAVRAAHALPEDEVQKVVGHAVGDAEILPRRQRGERGFGAVLFDEGLRRHRAV